MKYNKSLTLGLNNEKVIFPSNAFHQVVVKSIILDSTFKKV